MKTLFTKFGLVTFSLLLSFGTLGVIADSLPFVEASEDLTTRTIDDRLDQLTENMNALVESLTQLTQTPEVGENGLPEGAEWRSGAYYNYNYPSQSLSECNAGWQEWPSSPYYNQNAEWDISGVIQYNTSGLSQFIDINGDGLNDYISHNHLGGGRGYGNSADPNNPAEMYFYRTGRSCVALNNGTGFDIVYKCFITVDQETPDPVTGRLMTVTHYGDCADTTNP